MENIKNRTDGQLNKITIFSYEKKDLRGRARTFVIPVNPEQFSRTLQIKLEETQAPGTHGNNPRSNKTPPEEVKLDFIFDGTGTVENYYSEHKDKNVSAQIDEFLFTVYNFEPEIHQPRFLKFIWGGLLFECRLTNLQINYTLFNPDGTPLRAKLSATFKQYVESIKRVKIEDKRSPDLSKEKTVLEGENLPLISFDEYGDPNLYIQLAQQNNLTNFRKIRGGAAILLPPIERTSI